MSADEFLLVQTTDVKTSMLKSALAKNNFNRFAKIAQLFSNTPIKDGGLPIKIVKEIHINHLNQIS